MTKHRGRPWGWMIGLIAASLTILVGVGRGLTPDVIMLRAALAGVVCGMVARLVRTALIRLADAK
jgi:hypothetical protein